MNEAWCLICHIDICRRDSHPFHIFPTSIRFCAGVLTQNADVLQKQQPGIQTTGHPWDFAIAKFLFHAGGRNNSEIAQHKPESLLGRSRMFKQ